MLPVLMFSLLFLVTWDRLACFPGQFDCISFRIGEDFKAGARYL